MEIIEQRLKQIEETVDKTDKALDNHLIESEHVRDLVNAHDKKLMNGDWKELIQSTTEVREKVIKIEANLSSKGAAWKDIAMGVGMISTIIGVIYLVIQ